VIVGGGHDAEVLVEQIKRSDGSSFTACVSNALSK